ADHLRRWLAHVEAGLGGDAAEAPVRDEALLARIRGLCEAADSPGPAAEAAAPAPGLARMADAVESAGEPQAEAAAARPESPKAETMAVRVHTAKLDYLVDMAGEMVIAQSLVRHDPDLAALKSPRLQRNVAQLSRITAELQKTAMAMRLVPIGPLFRRMARLVRDLSRQFGKRVVMETQGDEIELDRNIVEELADPLMHMVRNALDHGIETPAERERQGKDPAARLVLRGSHHAGQVVIEIADDGRGLDREKILSKAIQKGLTASGEALSDSEVYNLIFQPGFTTAELVTNVSGRGVGMDVVRRHVEKLRGRIEIRSVPGQGATFLIKLPLTLAIIEGLVVGVGAERYIAPLFAVREILRPREDTVWTVQNRAEMALIRGSLLPLLRLYRRFGVQPRSENPLESALLVTEVEGQRFCLMVDELIGKQEVVIKSLGPTFKEVPGIAGGAILGDGRVGLILDLERLFRERSDEFGR
ncbi:MAG: chemotaxis protein CheA, partial [Acidobacteriia bacterium]|nr:chemotaxis protein CheA [Terriglobia bacterium]